MDRPQLHLWLMRALYPLLALLILFFHLLPLGTLPARWAPPDLLVALTLAWVLRRPDYVPLLSIAVVMLMADLLLQRPPGLLAALVVAGSAYLRSAAPGMRDAGFAAEWLTVGIVIVAIAFCNRAVLWITAVQQAPLWLVILQVAATLATYPLVVWISKGLFGVRRPALSESDALGGRA
ncbi:rod shape-determining protein MreD [Ruegeria marisrubri]|uniref:Rod shape-determining protein MreD n=1 Tax=Ruegeria marisrubri TaxID=1685379 RepID=A0A0X3TF74_9RHOB|nr:rod shape-determining protein MreD [Ruegeria marisrubri]KUJ73711.1 rod shape-determining protein MreD [Ruegeria marisrubri]